MKFLPLFLLAAAFSLSGCAQYARFAAGYERTYSVSYQDAEGRNIAAGVTLKPTKGLAK